MLSESQRQPIIYTENDSALEWKVRYTNLCIQAIRFQDPFVLGWMSAEETQLLLRASGILPDNSIIVESGAFAGKSTRYLLLGAIISKSTLYSVDLFTGELPGEVEQDVAEYRDRFRGDMEGIIRYHIGMVFPKDIQKIHWRPVRGDTIEVANKWHRGPVDVLFLDSNHAQAIQEFEAWYPHLSPTAMVLIHDVVKNDVKYGSNGPMALVRILQDTGWTLVDLVDKLAYLTCDVEAYETRKQKAKDTFMSVIEAKEKANGVHDYDHGEERQGGECGDQQ